MDRYIMRSHGVDHIVQCSTKEEAARRGLIPLDEATKAKPATKRRTPANKAATPEDK